jgi:hypothetical protein
MVRGRLGWAGPPSVLSASLFYPAGIERTGTRSNGGSPLFPATVPATCFYEIWGQVLRKM